MIGRSLSWHKLPLIQRIRWLRYILPPILVVVVVGYQLLIARALEAAYGHVVHYSIEIAFYSLSGPLVTWLTLVWVERNLSEKEALEQQVQARTKQLESLMASSSDAILVLDESHTVVSSNHGAEQLFGYHEESMLGKAVSGFVVDDDLLQKRLSERRNVRSIETNVRHRDGRFIPVDLALTAVAQGDSAGRASLMIIRDITLRREKEAILVEERERIARDLHDGVAQTLYFMALKADLARQQLADQPEESAEILKEISQNTRAAITEVRSTIFALQPLNWSEGEFFPALRNFVEGFAEQTNWALRLKIDPDLDSIPPDLEPTVFRLIQESLNNVAKHAQASQVQISLSHQGDPPCLVLEVADDGHGISAERKERKGMGLAQMQRRVEAGRGSFRIESRPGEGTTVLAALPLDGPSF